ncbi:unnamed protein product [Rhizoctonia solani]|uniref:Ubiquitin-like domain-containing protein n=1 Tax=Rhizoctonia solani TaxID=456999 RepID=A0A8H3E6F1_9AGAM|nr:unnamed protein product [Rhizoctonia solani]
MADNTSLQLSAKRPRSDTPESKPTDNKSPFLAVEYADRKVVVLRSTSYSSTIASIKKAFSQLRSVPDHHIQLFVKLEQLDDPAQVLEELWEELVPSLTLVTIVAITPATPPTPPVDNLPSNKIRFIVSTCSGGRYGFTVLPKRKIRSLRSTIQRSIGNDLPEEGFRLFHNGHSLGDDDTFLDHGIEDGDTIDLMGIQRGGKPVIYLFSPSPMLDVQVQLSLVKAWRFSDIYPPTHISSPSDDSLGETISWSVDTRPDGTLFDRLTNREVAYLFWEAHTNPKPPISPPTSPSAELVAFDPACPIISPNNSALLPFDKVTGYIDDALLAMELHVEARTSFITYWLPNLSKHSYIALCFLPQDQYEASAPLRVTPAPEITTRVFMLFMGVEENDLEVWKAATVPAGEWARIVGVDTVKAKNTSLFRVLEWGGMEIQ